MGLFGRKEPGTELVPQGPVEPVVEEPAPDTEFIWRCRCGSMGIHRESLHAHVGKFRKGRMCEADDIKHYVLAVELEYEAKAAEVSASDTWIIVKLPDHVSEGEVGRFRGGAENPWPTTVVESSSGLSAIQEWYSHQIGELSKSATDEEREKCNGRYVALNFFTGHRAEALIESEWRAKVEVAEGSHA